MADVTAEVFEAPGPGFWQLDRSHTTGGATPIIQWLQADSAEAGFRRLFAEFGVPADTISFAWVNGFNYTRLRPLVGGDKPAPSRQPPAFVLKALLRLHPEFRRRERAAARTLAERPWRRVVAEWHRDTRPRLVARNLALQEVELATLDDAALAAHVEDVLAHVREQYELHFWLHGFDLGPLGLFILECRRWDISAAEAVRALVGASPSTSAPRQALARIRAEVDAAGTRPGSLDDIRAVSPAAAAALDDYLRLRGWVLYTSYDIDGRTLIETPDVLVATVLDGRDAPSAGPDPALVAQGLRDRVPVGDRPVFDDLLDDARAAMDLRDDNGPTTVEWPLGLLRRAMLEGGRRLTATGRLQQAEHVVELDRHEVGAVLRGSTDPTADEVADRAARRAAWARLDAPRTLGEPEPEPPLDVMPPNQRRMIEVVQAITDEMGMSDGATDTEPLQGVGVGETPYQGRARVALTPEDAIASLEPGDVLVTRTTTPAYNLVLTMVGALVTVEGGPMSHAAVLARELGFAAVVGAAGALETIPDGALVEVDPAVGRVTVLDTSPQAAPA
jgi:rifampicin phosphotransferase